MYVLGGYVITIQELQEKGFRYNNRHIRCLGRIQLPGDGHWENTPDICGWYENFDGGFTAFVTNEERGLIKSAMEYKTEEVLLMYPEYHCVLFSHGQSSASLKIANQSDGLYN